MLFLVIKKKSEFTTTSGEPQAKVVGSVLDGVFSGYISMPQETFYIEKSWLYFNQDNHHKEDETKSHFPNNYNSKAKPTFQKPSFHSVIYSSRHVEQNPMRFATYYFV